MSDNVLTRRALGGYLASENYRMMLLLRSQHLKKGACNGTCPACNCYIHHLGSRFEIFKSLKQAFVSKTSNSVER